MCVLFFVCFLFFETTREKSFFSLVVDLCVVGLSHTKVFVSFLFFSFFLRLMKRTTTARHKKRV